MASLSGKRNNVRRAALALLLLAYVAWPAVGQRYKVNPAGRGFNSKKLKEAKKKKADVVRGIDGLAANRALLEEYFNSYFFPSMTDPDMKGQLADMRKELTSDLANSSGDAHEFLVKTAYTKCRELLSSKYDPAVRYNCALVLGDLNETEADIKSATPAVPYSPALRDLAKWFANDKLDDATRVATLIGIRRHARLSGPKNAPSSLYKEPKVQSYLIGKLWRFASTADAPSGRSNEAHQWMRQLAVEALGYLRSPGPKAAVPKLMVKIVNEAKSPIALRCAAVEALARLDLEGTGVTGDTLSETAGQAVFVACKWEVDQIMEYVRANGGPRNNGGRPQPRPEEVRGRKKEFTAVDPTTIPYRRRLIHSLLTIRRALDGEPKEGIVGIKTMDGAAEKAGKVIEIIDEVVSRAEDETSDLRALGKSIRSARLSVRTLISDVPADPSSA